MKLNKTQQLVLDTIRRYPGCADDDKLLLACAWGNTWDYNKSVYENLKRVKNPESITRARRKLHEFGLITYSKDADTRRMSEFKQYRDENSDYERRVAEHTGRLV